MTKEEFASVLSRTMATFIGTRVDEDLFEAIEETVARETGASVVCDRSNNPVDVCQLGIVRADVTWDDEICTATIMPSGMVRISHRPAA